jgi:TonB family protein
MSRILDASQSEAIRPIHRIFHTSRSDVVRLGRRIGSGAEGEVYEIQDQIDLVAKVYHQPPPPEKAEKLVLLSRLGNERLFNLSAWPVTTLLDAPGGQVVGFVMKKISQAEEVHALHSPKSRLQKFPEASWAFLIHAAANIARAVGAIHENGLVIGDVNPKNILVTRKATAYLLDVDSFQITVDGKTYRCEGGFPEYTPPELQGVAFRDVDRRRGHDCFGLAVVIFQLLFMGRHPYSGRYLGAGEMPLERAIRESRFAYGEDAEAREMRCPPGTLTLDSVPQALVDLFRRAFLTTDRPQPGEWIEQLGALAKALNKCDLHSRHYYYSDLRECPWCGIETHARVRLFNFLLPEKDSRRGHFRLDEIWKEIAVVEAPGAPLIQWDKILKAPSPSAEAAAFARVRNKRLILALIFSAFAGLAIPIFLPIALWNILPWDFALWIPTPVFFLLPSFLLLILAGLIAREIARTKSPLLENFRARQRQAKEEAQRLQEQYDCESENERWDAKLDELRIRKGTYENLAQIKQSGGGVPTGTRLRNEREIDALRFRLETELSVGARDLRHMKQEIETSRRMLRPALTQARQELAQAEKDLEVGSKRGSVKLIMTALIVTFIIGTGILWRPYRPDPELEARILREMGEKSLKLSIEGERLSKEGKFEEAIATFREAIRIDPYCYDAYVKLGYVFYSLKRYEESVEASEGALRCRKIFEPYYNLGLAYMELGRWDKAGTAFYDAADHISMDSWEERYTLAFYYLARSQTQERGAGPMIEALEKGRWDYYPRTWSVLQPLHFGSLYLWVGKPEAAMAQYEILKKDNSKLAEELLKLIKQHGVRRPAGGDIASIAGAGVGSDAGGDMGLGGGHSVEPMTASLRPTILHREKAKYTEEARQNKIQGAVVLQVVFNVNGSITDVRVISGLPDGLTEKAIEAAKKIRFNPAVKNGAPVSVRGSLEFTFSLY